MSIFHRYKQIFPDIVNEDDFNSSKFAGSEELLQTDWDKCLIASEEDDDSITDLYYFIEGDAEHITYNGNMILCELSDTKIVLFDDYEYKAIIIHKDSKDNLESFI